MARIVVRNRDKVNRDDPELDRCCLKRGMVVDVLPDGMSLGTVGEKYTGWTVIELPGVSPEELAEFLRPGKKMRRTVKLNLDAYEAGQPQPLHLAQVRSLKLPVEGE